MCSEDPRGAARIREKKVGTIAGKEAGSPQRKGVSVRSGGEELYETDFTVAGTKGGLAG